jgi:xylulokinase
LWRGVEAVAFAAARQTFAPVDASGRPTGPGIVWSDQRAPTAGGRARWLAEHEPAALTRARWLLAPRDLVVLRLTGRAVTDVTLASRAGWYEPEDAAPDGLLPPVVPATTIVGDVTASAADALGLGPDVTVVLGAGDRACEVLGTAAESDRPMVSWGTTANVSIPAPDRTRPVPPAAVVSAGALDGELWECGLSAAGSALDWWAGITGRGVDELAALAVSCPPGSRGVLALAWLGGARAPWWQPAARAALIGLSAAHGAAEVTRALFESVGYDVARCIESLGAAPVCLAAAGAGSATAPWPQVLAGITALPIERRRPELAASVGARIIAGAALGQPVDADACNPVTDVVEPVGRDVEAYHDLRPAADAVAAAVLGLGPRR